MALLLDSDSMHALSEHRVKRIILCPSEMQSWAIIVLSGGWVAAWLGGALGFAHICGVQSELLLSLLVASGSAGPS